MTFNNFRYDSGDSMGSQRSSDLSIDEEREHFRRDTERQALYQLQKVRTKPVAFSVKTNCAFDGTVDDDSPVQGAAISFDMHDHLHVMERYDQNWWIGRKVMEGCDVGFIPSPAKLEVLRNLIAQSKNAKTTANKMSTPAAASAAKEKAANLAKLLPGNKNKETPKIPAKPQSDDEEGVEMAQPAPVEMPDPLPGSALSEPERKKKGAFGQKKVEIIPPYDVVPSMRPIVVIGPSLKGYEVTDMMQNALFELLKKRYKNRVVISRVSVDLALGKKMASCLKGNEAQQKKSMMGDNSDPTPGVVKGEVDMETERIFDMAKTLQLVVLDCDTVNHPQQLIKTSLNPIQVYLQISSPKVLTKLIKSRGKSEARNMHAQMVAAEKLAQCPLDMWDIVLQENSLTEAAEHLCGWLDEYWAATHLPSAQPNTLGSHLGALKNLASMTAPMTAIAQNLAGGLAGPAAMPTSSPRPASPTSPTMTNPSSRPQSPSRRLGLGSTTCPPAQLHQAGPVLERGSARAIALASGKMGTTTAATAVEVGSKTPVAPGRMRRSLSKGWGDQFQGNAASANNNDQHIRNKYGDGY